MLRLLRSHFETPVKAYADILPVLQAEADQRHQQRLAGARNRLRSREKREMGSSTLQRLVIYDPYYCQGGMVDALESLGCNREHVINQNRDFYSDAAQVCTALRAQMSC